MKFLVLFSLFVAAMAAPDADADAKAKADAEAYYALYGYYPAWYHGYYGHGIVYGKRSADADAEAEAKAKADVEAEAHYALYGYYPVGYVAHPYINLYGKRSADADAHLYGYGLGYAYRPYYGYYYGK